MRVTISVPPLLLCILPIAALAQTQSFHALVVGGTVGKANVTLYNVLSPQKGCPLPPLVENAPEKPLLGFMDGNVTACGGALPFCNYFDPHNKLWKESFPSPVAEIEAHVTTFDGRIWTIFVHGSYIYVWKQGMSSFSKEESGQELRGHRCSVRKNQTHVITSNGGHQVYLYEEEGYRFEALNDFDSEVRAFSNCGLYLNPDSGFQYVSVGGNLDEDGSTIVFHFDSNSWSEGQNLPARVSQTDKMQFQNTLIVIATLQESILHENLFLYDDEEGWIALEVTLNEKNFNMGMMHLPPGMMQCESTNLG